MSATRTVRFLHSWGMFFVAAALMAAAALTMYTEGHPDYIGGDRGIVFPSANLWIGDHAVELCVNVAATIGIALLMTLINRHYNLLQTMSMLGSSLFLVLTVVTPGLLVQFYTGTLLAVTLTACLFLLYSTYGDTERAPRRIFLIFFILSAMTMTQYCYAVFIPVFIAGCWQMCVATGRTFVGLLLGLVTPWWIVLGSGLVDPADLHAPELEALFSSFDLRENALTYVAVFFSGLLLVTAWVINFPRMIAYNSRMRAFNGSLSLLSLVTVLAVFVDFINVSAYAPVLFLCTAYYAGRVFAVHKKATSFIPILAIVAVCGLLFALNVVIE